MTEVYLPFVPPAWWLDWSGEVATVRLADELAPAPPTSPQEATEEASPYGPAPESWRALSAPVEGHSEPVAPSQRLWRANAVRPDEAWKATTPEVAEADWMANVPCPMGEGSFAPDYSISSETVEDSTAYGAPES